MITVAKKRGRPPHIWSETSAIRVRDMASNGVTQDTIARRLGISPTTLRKHYGSELDAGASEAHAAVERTLYSQAITGENTAATIYYLKCQAGWKEARPDTPSEHEARLLKTMRELRVNAGDVEAILRVMSLPQEQRGAALAVQERAKRLKGGAE